jgi:hypothetical protein
MNTDISGSAIINTANEMNVIFNIPYGQNDTYLSNSAVIAFREHLRNKANIELLKKELYSNALIPYTQNLSGKVAVNENLTMNITMGILRPPVITMEITPIKDAYTRESRPYINYGHSTSLAVGQASEGEFRTYIEFDISDILDITDQVILSVKLELTKATSNSGIINLYEVYSQWNEGLIIWMNPIQYSPTPLIEVDINDYKTTLNMYPFLMQLIDNDNSKMSLFLKSDNFLTLSSRESATPPKLIIEYTDPSWDGHIGINHFKNSACIKTHKNKYFYGTANIAEYNIHHGIAILKEKGLIDNEAVITNPLLYNIANILGNMSNIASSADIRNTSDLTSMYDKNATEGYGAAILLTKNLMSSTAIIPPGSAINFYDGHVNISRPFIHCMVDVLDKILQGGVAIIRASNNNDTNSFSGIINPLFTGNALLTIFDNLSGFALIGEEDFTDTPSEAQISPWLDFYSTSTIVSPWSNNIYSNVKIKHRNDAIALAKVKYKEEMHNIATILNSFYMNMLSEAHLIGTGKNNLYSMALLKEFSSLYNTVSIINMGDSALNNSAYIMIPDSNDFNAEGTVHLVSDKSAYVSIKRISQLLGSVIIREYNVDLFNGQASLNGWHPSYLEAIATILARNYMKHSIAEIINTAREWKLPTNENRLPREWKWEDFFPVT